MTMPLRPIASLLAVMVTLTLAAGCGEKREQLETQILEDKLIKHLLDGSKITDGPFEVEGEKNAGEQKETA